MSLEGQERGYAMAALLVSLAVMSVLMSVALPAWRHEAQREKEAELVFRGEQYARAIALYRAKTPMPFRRVSMSSFKASSCAEGTSIESLIKIST